VADPFRVRLVLLSLFANAGPLTGAFEELATAIGAGIVVVTGGYFGGGLALMLLTVDIVRKHFV
jgi:hypothetical protein